MKKLLVILACAACAVTVTVRAADTEGNKQLTDDQKGLRKQLIEKYDTNKDGKLDKDERSKMTAEDKEKWASVSGKKHADKSEAKTDATK